MCKNTPTRSSKILFSCILFYFRVLDITHSCIFSRRLFFNPSRVFSVLSGLCTEGGERRITGRNLLVQPEPTHYEVVCQVNEISLFAKEVYMQLLFRTGYVG